jgi:hypothetical protein
MRISVLIPQALGLRSRDVYRGGRTVEGLLARGRRARYTCGIKAAQCGPTISVTRMLVCDVSPLTTGRPAPCQPAVPPARL